MTQGRRLQGFGSYSGQQIDRLEDAYSHKRLMPIGEWQRVESVVEVIAMPRIQLAMEQEVAESLARQTDAVGRVFEKFYVRRRSLEHCDKSQQRDRMNVPDPVVLRSGERCRRR
jgi:hypothetical protein